MDKGDPGTTAQKKSWGIFIQLGLVAGAWAFLYRDAFPMLLSQWGTDDFSYCYLVPLAAGYFTWEGRRRILASAGGSIIPGLLLLLFSGVVFLAGRLGALETLLYVSMWLSVGAIALIFLGHRTLSALIFPMLILAFIVPPPAFIERTLSFNLRLISSSLAAQLLQIMNIPVFVEGNILDIGTMRLQVVDACSGLRYLLPTIFLSLIVGHMLLKSMWARVALLLGSAPVAIGLNAVRLVVTAVLARYVSPKFVEGFLHDFQGWVIYLVTVGVLAGVGLLLRKLERKADVPVTEWDVAAAREPCPASLSVGHLTGIYIVTILVMLSVSIGAYAKEQIVPEWTPLNEFPLEIGPWKGTREYLDKTTLDSLWADDYHLATYTNTQTGRVVYLFIPYYKQQRAQHTAHAPTSCLIGSGWEIRTRNILSPKVQSGRDFSVQQLMLGKSGERLLSNFWFQQRGRVIVSELENKFFLLTDSFMKNRTDGALVRVEMQMLPDETPDSAQNELDMFVGQAKQLADKFIPK